MVRRTVESVHGALGMTDGGVREIDKRFLIRPLEQALWAMSSSVVLLAAGLAVARLT